jgi:hypothetical protein
MSLKALVLAIWAAIHPSAPKLPDAPEIASAIEVVITQDKEPPVFGSREEDAAVMAYYALRESWLRKHAVGDGGRSFGVWQENEKTGRADIITQARAWLYMLHEGARICPDNPAAPLSGGCTAAARMAARRVEKARQLLDIAKRALSTADETPASPGTRSAASSPAAIDGTCACTALGMGMRDAPATRRSSRLRRRTAGATIARVTTPIRHVPGGWRPAFA